MNTIRIDHKPSYLGVYVMLTLAAFSSLPLLFGEVPGPGNIVGVATAFSIAVLFAWTNLVGSKRSVEIDPDSKVVVIRKVSAFLRPRCIQYPLDRFGSVRSYLVNGGRVVYNIVELVTKEGGRALMVGSFEPASKAKSFTSIPVDDESEQAAALRADIAAATKLKDSGFLGVQMIGAQMKE